MSLRSWIAYLVCAGERGTVLVASAAAWFSWREQERELRHALLTASRRLVRSAGREVDQAVALARGLSVSAPLLECDFLWAFDGQARTAIEDPR